MIEFNMFLLKIIFDKLLPNNFLIPKKQKAKIVDKCSMNTEGRINNFS